MTDIATTVNEDSMTTHKVFIAGSRGLSRLNIDVKRRIDAMMEKSFTILVGDANGADKAVQKYAAEKAYRDVIVHCMAGKCRNNLANWPTREITASPGARGFEYYSTKDLAMVDEAEYGLMLWDGESKGTLNSVINMIHQNKMVVVYLSPKKEFQNLSSPKDVARLLSKCDLASVRRFERELNVSPIRMIGFGLSTLRNGRREPGME
jgi:hypothetical protein